MADHEKRMHKLLYSNEGRVEQCERICSLEKVAKELWLLLMFTGNDDAYAEIGFSGKQAVIDAYKLRDRMVDLGIVLPQVPMSDDDLIDYLSEELGIEVQDE